MSYKPKNIKDLAEIKARVITVMKDYASRKSPTSQSQIEAFAIWKLNLSMDDHLRWRYRDDEYDKAVEKALGEHDPVIDKAFEQFAKEQEGEDNVL